MSQAGFHNGIPERTVLLTAKYYCYCVYPIPAWVKQ